MSVGIVVVSHSPKVAEGTRDLALQMAADVTVLAAGGTDDGSIGTSFDKITAALAEAEQGEGVAVLCDLGSAILTADTAIELLDEDEQGRVRWQQRSQLKGVQIWLPSWQRVLRPAVRASSVTRKRAVRGLPKALRHQPTSRAPVTKTGRRRRLPS